MMNREVAGNSFYRWIVLAGLACASFLLLAYVMSSAYQDGWSDARGVATSQAQMVEARFEATLRRIEATLDELANRTPPEALDKAQRERYRSRMEADLAGHLRLFPEVAGFRIIDANGDVLYLSGGGEYPNLADRDYFRLPRDYGGDSLFFSTVIESRITGRQAMVAARAIHDADGGFRGVVTAAIELEYFEALFRSVRLGESGVVAIRRTDNQALVVREPAVPAEINRPLSPTHPMVAQLAHGERHGVLEFVAQADGVRRLYGFRVLERYPFYVLSGLSEADVMAYWQQRVFLVATIAAAVFGCLVVVMFGLVRAQQREREAASRVQRGRDRLNAAQHIARLGSWDIELPSMRVHCSDELFRIFDVEPASSGLTVPDFMAKVHPDDRALVEAKLQESIRECRPVSLKHRLLVGDGQIRYVFEMCEPELGSDGKPMRVIGTTQDITERHEMEARLQLLASAVEHSGEAILITDAENRIITVNPAFTRLTGYAQEEAVGRNPRFLSAGRTTPEDYQRLWSSLNETDFWQGEIWDRRKDGGIYPKWMAISVIRDAGGEVCYYVARFTDVSSERAAEERLHHIAHHDMLTGLLNRFSLKVRLDQALSAARREGSRVAVLFIDLDRFKVVNDTLGHHVGDQLLIEVARRLRESVRDSDVVARLGGDEFVVMLSGIEHSSAVALVAEKLALQIGEPCELVGHTLYTTPSIGVAIYPTDGEDGETLMKNADAAMYHAKTAGRNNFQFFDAKMNDVAVERLRIEHSLRQALANQQFRLHYQPIIHLPTGRVTGLEALLRWEHPQRGLLSPGVFIGIAEETGLIQPIGEWVLRTACRQLADLFAAGISDLRMGINISAIQMRNANLPDLVRDALETCGLDPARLVLEITESAAMAQPEETVRLLDLLHAMGISLAIDDFGTGYSSLSYLRMFPITHLKLDRSFVQEIGQGEGNSAICDATIGLAHNLGLKIIAEGVETQEQLDYLQGQGCDFIQGYLISKPIPADAVIDFVRNYKA